MCNKVVMWKLLYILFSIILQVLCGKLVGDHICLTEESYTVNVTEHYVRNATVRNYQWCMNVPPRCSFYTIKKVNNTRIIMKPQIRVVEKCCEGFYEKNNACVPVCQNCVNGICYKEACRCSPGYHGKNCDNICQSGYWGLNCLNQCDCEYKLCNPVNGNCKFTNNDTTIVYNNTYIKLKDTSYHTPTSEVDHILRTDQQIPQANSNNNNINSLTTNEITTYNNKVEVTSTYDMSMNTPSPKDGTILAAEITSPKQIAENNYEDDVESFSYAADSVKNDLVDITTATSKTIFQTNIEDNTHYRNNFLNGNQNFYIPVEIKYDQITKPLSIRNTKVTTQSTFSEENRLIGADKNGNDHHISSQDNNLIKSITISVATTISLIILAIVLLTIDYSRKNNKKKEKNTNPKKNAEISTVSIYATSIFHTPLPDPPTFENPSYLTPMEYQNSKSDPRTFETHVVCNVNLDNQSTIDCRDSVYDHPPSTGSYRAASIIEPLDIDHKPPIMQIEPVYDEIPCRGVDTTPYCNQPLSLYINTCGRTSY